MLGMWAVILAAIGHADTARMFAANVALRAVQMLTRLSTAKAVNRRSGAPRQIRAQARRLARFVQLGVLAATAVVLAAMVYALDAIGQHQIALFLPLIAVGMPARILRFSDVRPHSPYFRLALSGGGLALALLAWAVGLGAVGVALAFGMREWLAYGVVRFWPGMAKRPDHLIAEPLTFAEVARNTALSGRRLLTYRMTKIALTLFGPIGNVAARTGRGLNWHNRIEPFLPHRLWGFILMATATFAGALFLAWRSGEPAAMVAAAGLMQLAGASANIAGLWKYLPDRSDPDLIVEEDDDE